MVKTSVPLLTLDDIAATVAAYARQIDAPEIYLPTYGYSEDGARPHIERDGPKPAFGYVTQVDPPHDFSNDAYHYVVVERGKENIRCTTQDIDELLYWIFRQVTSEMSNKYELANRVPTEDFRRINFRHRLELLEKLDSRWRDRERVRLIEILSRHPFSDDGPPNLKNSGNGD